MDPLICPIHELGNRSILGINNPRIKFDIFFKEFCVSRNEISVVLERLWAWIVETNNIFHKYGHVNSNEGGYFLGLGITKDSPNIS